MELKLFFPAGYIRVKINPSPIVFINSNTSCHSDLFLLIVGR